MTQPKKFRALIRNISSTSPMWVTYSTGELFNWKEEACIVKDLQYTGLKDKTGKEIYEGDVIKCKIASMERNCQVIWEDHVVRNDYEGQYADLNGFTTFGRWKIVGINGGALAMHTGQFEIIGDIYLNPELLTNN